jgi:multidrug efflux system membrane fusion protein
VQAGEAIARVRDAEYREHVNRAAGSVREAEAALAKAKLYLERARGLFAVQSLTRPELDAAESAFESGEARLASARAQLSLTEISLRDCALVAPLSGVVLERRVEAGAQAGTGTIGFVIGRVAQVKAVFGVPDLLVHRITPGTELDVATEAFGDARFRGRVTAISPAADQQSRVFNVEVALPNGDGRLKPGMIGRVEIVAGPAASAENGAVDVPLVAVVQAGKSEQGYAVFVVEGAAAPVARRRPVVLGDVRGNAVAVTRGLQPGERIVVSGASMLVDGETVHVIP